jgi:hypothetical protein
MLGLLALVISGAALAWQARDDDGRTLTLPIHRSAWSAFARRDGHAVRVGGGARVVGTPDFSVEPRPRAPSRIGDSHGFDLERIPALHRT